MALAKCARAYSRSGASRPDASPPPPRAQLVEWADDTEGVVFASDGGAGEAAAPSPHARASPSTACDVKKTSRG